MNIGDLVEMRQMRAPFDDKYGAGIIIDLYPGTYIVEYKVKFAYETLWVEESNLLLISNVKNAK